MSGTEFPFRSQQAACSSVVYFSNIRTFWCFWATGNWCFQTFGRCCELSGGYWSTVALSTPFSAPSPTRVTQFAVMMKLKFHLCCFSMKMLHSDFCCPEWDCAKFGPAGLKNSAERMSAHRAKLPLMYLIVLRKYRKVFFLFPPCDLP